MKLTKKQQMAYDELRPVWIRCGSDLALVSGMTSPSDSYPDNAAWIIVRGNREQWESLLHLFDHLDVAYRAERREMIPVKTSYFGTRLRCRAVRMELEDVPSVWDIPEDDNEFRLDGVYLNISLWDMVLEKTADRAGERRPEHGWPMQAKFELWEKHSVYAIQTVEIERDALRRQLGKLS